MRERNHDCFPIYLPICLPYLPPRVQHARVIAHVRYAMLRDATPTFGLAVETISLDRTIGPVEMMLPRCEKSPNQRDARLLCQCEMMSKISARTRSPSGGIDIIHEASQEAGEQNVDCLVLLPYQLRFPHISPCLFSFFSKSRILDPWTSFSNRQAVYICNCRSAEGVSSRVMA